MCSCSLSASLPSLALRRFSCLLVFSVLGLIFFGALVKSHEAGLAVPDWPRSFGENMFTFPPSKWIDKIWYEHVHRLIASGIGVLTVIAAIWVSFQKQVSRTTKWLAWVCVLAVSIQGILGGLTVLHRLPVFLSASHGVLAQSFLVLCVILAYQLSSEWNERKIAQAASGDARLYRLSLVFFFCIFVQLVVGAIMRHMEAGLALPDFPLHAGRVLPSLNDAALQAINEQRASLHFAPVSGSQVFIHLVHRYLGIAIFLLGVPFSLLAYRSSRTKPLQRSFFALGILLLIQFLLGIFTIWSGRNPTTTSLHVLFGAILIGLMTLCVLRSRPIQSKSSLRAQAQ